MRPVLFFIILVCFASCKKTSSHPITVTLEDCSAVITHGQDNLQLCLDSIVEESRCPANAMCVWQGIAKARFYFKINQVIHTVYLSTSNLTPHYSNDTTVGNYKLKLINLYPYPGTGGNQGAEVVIEP